MGHLNIMFVFHNLPSIDGSNSRNTGDRFFKAKKDSWFCGHTTKEIKNT